MFSFGSDGEDGNDGGDVSVVHSGVMKLVLPRLVRSFSQGIFAQSIGGWVVLVVLRRCAF